MCIRDRNAGLVPRCHLEDVTRADFYGFVVPFVNEIMELSEEDVYKRQSLYPSSALLM